MMWTHCYCVRVGRKSLVLESDDSLVVQGEADAGAGRGPQVSSSPKDEPTAPRQEGTGRNFLKDPWAAHSTVTA